MRKKLTIIIFLIIFFNCITINAQFKEEECRDLSDLKELTIDEKKYITESANKVIDQKYSKDETRLRVLYCPPTELYFNENCDFPLNTISDIYYYLGLLYNLPKSILILKTHSDSIAYKKNRNLNSIRAENVEKIFMYYGISTDRIKIIDLKDKYPTDTNKTKEGRNHNRYVRMSVVF